MDIFSSLYLFSFIALEYICWFYYVQISTVSCHEHSRLKNPQIYLFVLYDLIGQAKRLFALGNGHMRALHNLEPLVKAVWTLSAFLEYIVFCLYIFSMKICKRTHLEDSLHLTYSIHTDAVLTNLLIFWGNLLPSIVTSKSKGNVQINLEYF